MIKKYLNFKSVLITLICALLLGCASKIPRVNPYSGLLPEGYQLKIAKLTESPAELKNRSLGMVAGANFEKYTEAVYKSKETIKSLQNSPLGILSTKADNQALDDNLSMSDPKRMTLYFGQILEKQFSVITVYPDIASARTAKVDYIAILDYSYELENMSKGFIYGQVDLLNSRLERIISVKSEIINDTSKVKYSILEDGSEITKRMNAFISTNIKKCLEDLGSKFNVEINK